MVVVSVTGRGVAEGMVAGKYVFWGIIASEVMARAAAGSGEGRESAAFAVLLALLGMHSGKVNAAVIVGFVGRGRVVAGDVKESWEQAEEPEEVV